MPKLQRVARFLVLLLVVPLCAGAAEDDAEVLGVWQLNLDKSVFNPGPPPRSLVYTHTRVADGIAVEIRTITAQGKETVTTFTYRLGGPPVAVSGTNTPPNSTIQFLRSTPNTVIAIRHTGEEIMSTTERVMALDGRSFTSHIKGSNSAGQVTNHVLVFEKQ